MLFWIFTIFHLNFLKTHFLIPGARAGPRVGPRPSVPGRDPWRRGVGPVPPPAGGAATPARRRPALAAAAAGSARPRDVTPATTGAGGARKGKAAASLPGPRQRSTAGGEKRRVGIRRISAVDPGRAGSARRRPGKGPRSGEGGRRQHFAAAAKTAGRASGGGEAESGRGRFYGVGEGSGGRKAGAASGSINNPRWAFQKGQGGKKRKKRESRGDSPFCGGGARGPGWGRGRRPAGGAQVGMLGPTRRVGRALCRTAWREGRWAGERREGGGVGRPGPKKGEKDFFWVFFL